MRLFDRVHPEVVLLENVAELAGDVHGDALDVILVAFNHRGFDTQVFLVNSSDFCLAQTRKRMLILAVLRPGRKLKIDNYIETFQTITDLVRIFKMEPPCLSEVFLAEDHPQVQGLLGDKSEKAPVTWLSNTIDVHMEAWRKLGLRWQATQAHESDRKSEWFEVLSAREKDRLAYGQRAAAKFNAGRTRRRP